MSEEKKKIRPQDKWNAAHGLKSFTFKLNENIANDFAEACKRAGSSKKAALEKLMIEYAKTH